MESIGWCDYKVQCSCKACVFQAGLDIGIQILTLGPVFLYLYSVCFYSTSFCKLSLSLWQTKWPPVSSSKLTSFKTSNHRAHRTSLYQCLFINSRQGCDHFFLNHMPKSEPTILAGRGILVTLGHKLNPLHLGTQWSPGLNGGAEEFPKQIKEWKWEGTPLNKKI